MISNSSGIFPAGLSSSLPDQLKQILQVVDTGLKSVNTTYRKNHKKQLERQRLEQFREAENAKQRQRILDGTWHDARLDCVAGNGVMCELGVGDELFGEADKDARKAVEVSAEGEKTKGDKKVISDAEKEKRQSEEETEKAEDERKKQMSEEDMQAIEAMPIVILKGFQSKSGSARREALLDELATWAAALAENQVAHVIVVSDNRENAKQLAKGTPYLL